MCSLIVDSILMSVLTRRATPDRAAGPHNTPTRVDQVPPHQSVGDFHHEECNNNSHADVERRPSQDDSVVYAESKGKGRLKAKRRGESFRSV